MNKKVFLTFAGNTDPTRDDYDGPIIHICRYYRPEKIYLILTKELVEKNIDYERAIRENLKDYKFNIEIIPTDIVNAHHFEVFFTTIYNTFEKIKKEYPEAEILVNITSGTAQMAANLITYIVNAVNIKITPLQVETPAKKGNTSKVVGKNYDIQLSAENNLDNDEEYRVNRIIEPDLNWYSRIFVKNQIKKLIEQYDYSTSIEILKRKIFENNHELNTLLNFANDRKHLKGLESNKKLVGLNNKKYDTLFYYTKDKKNYKVKRWYKIVDYFALANIKQKSGDITGYGLMLEPLIINIYLSILEDILEKNLNSLLTVKGEIYKVNLSKIGKELQGHIKEKMKKMTNKNFDTLKNDIFVSDIYLIGMIDYFLKKDEKLSKIMDREYFDSFSKLLYKVKNTRNNLAHTLINVSKKDFEAEIETTIEKINSKISSFFENYYQKIGYKKHMLLIYDEINNFIVKILEQEK